jgi:STE24 endopeptidase
LAVRAVYRFRPPTGQDAEWLTWLRRQTEIHCGTPAGHLDWYVRNDPTPNAFAAGRRSIALTTGFLQLVYAARLTPNQVVAVAVHEFGHHVTGGPRYGLVVDWLSWPWRIVYRTAIRIGHALPLSGAATLLMPVVCALAIVSIVRAGGPPWQVMPVLVAIVAVALSVTVHPVVDAALTRASEYAADAYTAGLGMGPDLAVALHLMSPGRPGTPPGRACDTHPAADARQEGSSARLASR